MGRRRRSCVSFVWKLAASIAAICICKGSAEITEEASKISKPCRSKKSNQSNIVPASESFLMLVSTMDGRLTALNIQDKGHMAWSVESGLGPLISSSLSKMEINRNGVLVRLVQALDGVLYQYDGESIEAMPITAEALLSSSYRVSDDTVVVGGKEIQTYGVDATTGKLQYTCSSDGCKYFGEQEIEESDDIIVVKRNMKTVRAVECRSGGERWNFSVSQHDVQFLPGIHSTTGEESDTDDDDGDISIQICPSTDDAEQTHDITRTRVNTMLNVVVPTGQVMAFDKDDRSLLWKYKFDSPIAAAWTLDQGKLETVNLFDQSIVPALADPTSDHADLPPEPFLYLGTYRDQVYVQPSEHFSQTIHEYDTTEDSTEVTVISALRVLWRPYIATAPSRTPALRGVRLPALSYVTNTRRSQQGDVVVWTDNYPYDVGYYLYPDSSPVTLDNSSFVEENDITVTLWNWWKEVTVISLVTSVLFHILITKYLHKLRQGVQRLSSHESESSENSLVTAKYDLFDEMKRVSESKDDEYVSLYEQNFEHVQTLGSGGFGVVFEAKKRMEDVSYAVKRIPLHLSNEATDKSLREVRTLAKLDHIGIVSYKNSWIESPPIGWQEIRDTQRQQAEGLTSSHVNLPSLLPFSHTNYSPTHHTAIDIPPDSSRGFHTHKSDPNDESGSFSWDRDGSLEKDFADDTKSGGFDTNINSTTDINSSGDYKNDKTHNIAKSKNTFTSKNPDESDSFIVFEDSGCSTRDVGAIANHDFLCDMPVSSSESHRSHLSHTQNHSAITACQISKQRHYLFIQMQLCRRETLKDWLASNTLNRQRETILDIFYQIVAAMDYVHSNGFIHRDLKPSNIFFSMEEVVKIGDFGLVTATVGKPEESTTVSNGQTSEGDQHTAQVGTSLYMSPEQVSGEVYSSQVDIYSLGMILFELFYPFGTEMERYSTLTSLKKGMYPPRFTREMPREHKIVQWLLSERPDDRPTASDILSHELLEAYRSQRNLHLGLRPRASSAT